MWGKNPEIIAVQGGKLPINKLNIFESTPYDKTIHTKTIDALNGLF